MRKKTPKTVAISIEPKRPLAPAEEQLAQALANIARRMNRRIVPRQTAQP